MAIAAVFGSLGGMVGTPAAHAASKSRATAWVNERSGAGMSYRVEQVVPKGGVVSVLSDPVNGGWIKVNYRGTTGYIWKSYLSRASGLGGTSGGSSHSSGKYSYTTANLNLRSGPSTGYYVKRVIANGSRVSILGGPYSGNWYKVSYSGISGFVYGGYLSGRSSTGGSNNGGSTSGYGSKWIDINLSNETMSAYLGNHLVASTYVTTGNYRYVDRRTPTGTYHVMWKERNHVFYSPWPPGSLYYYAPSYSNYDLYFRYGGYYIHDAPWRWNFGPGSNMSYGSPGGPYTGSHGCVNTPYSFMKWMYYWANVGTPVVIHY